MKEQKKIRDIVLLASVAMFIIIAFTREIKNYFGYIILVIFTIQGIKAVADFLLGLPMQISYSGKIPSGKGRGVERVILLLMGIGIISFGIWWIFIKGI